MDAWIGRSYEQADLIGRQKFETKNRTALILLDSNFEIALKEFIVNRKVSSLHIHILT